MTIYYFSDAFYFWDCPPIPPYVYICQANGCISTSSTALSYLILPSSPGSDSSFCPLFFIVASQISFSLIEFRFGASVESNFLVSFR